MDRWHTYVACDSCGNLDALEALGSCDACLDAYCDDVTEGVIVEEPYIQRPEPYLDRF